ELRKSLRLARLEDLFQDKADGNGPWLRGLEVLRRELAPDGTPGPWVAVYQQDPKEGRAQGGGQTARLLRAGFYEDGDRQDLSDPLIPGLTTPLPLLVQGAYPPVAVGGPAGAKPVGALHRLPRGFGFPLVGARLMPKTGAAPKPEM